jgi:hypothetical protein
MNAGKVFAFRLDHPDGLWRLAQTLTNPDGFMVNDAFGAGVAIHGHSAMIGNGSLVQGPHLGNAAVYVYELEHGTWQYVQRLHGTQSTVTPLFFPQFSPDVVGVGDAFGNAIALDEDDAVITARSKAATRPALYSTARLTSSVARTSTATSAGF